MNQQKSSRKTPLFKWHRDHGANMDCFGSYEMPLWYPEGARQEHLSVITKAGMFDTSHMACMIISGKNAFNLLQNSFTRDLNHCLGKKQSKLVPGKCVYGIFLNDQGETIDDAILYQMNKTCYMLVVNSGMGGTIARHLESLDESKNVKIADLTDMVGKIDLQGPMSAKILLKVLHSAETVLKDMAYFSFKGELNLSGGFGSDVMAADGMTLVVSRSGYTGEFGFELFTSPEHLPALWDMLMDAGKDSGLIPCGLAARDSLRAGANLPLSHQDIGPWPFINNPWSFALPYNKDKSGFTKTFVGAKALLKNTPGEFTYPFVGSDLRKVTVSDPAVVLDNNDNPIGRVLTCVSDMAIGKHDGRIFSIASPDQPGDFTPGGLSCGFIKVKIKLDIGRKVKLKDKRREITVMVTDDIRPDRTARCRITDRL